MSSWLYRPTPVVVLGKAKAAAARGPAMTRWPAGTMHGIVLGWNYAPGLGKAKAARTGRQPWIKLSGTMGDFIPNGLGGVGQDDGSDFYSGAYASPVIPDSVPIVPPIAPDFNPIFSPTAPDLTGGGIPSSFFSGAFAGPNVPTPPISTALVAPTLAPRAGAGPTGTGIPGTQPLNLVAPAASLASALKNFFSPSTPKNISPAPGYIQTSGYGGAQPSFLAQSTIIPGKKNSTVLIGGAVALAVLVALGSSGGRRR